ncbi:hypothetical protein CBR_g57849 [Chara braunii]|uniref:Coiled-coil domain-containing protein 12 n=1 Tax=Chara braunii TaxID=69332 RepID=A0A388K873_CHABU|nr:hypothetical protein CBR_g57849 [Chara braunii]|eukprot:GBG66247.1 hypothetical protein CBR_g57849 [Chara braunii]
MEEALSRRDRLRALREVAIGGPAAEEQVPVAGFSLEDQRGDDADNKRGGSAEKEGEEEKGGSKGRSREGHTSQAAEDGGNAGEEEEEEEEDGRGGKGDGDAGREVRFRNYLPRDKKLLERRIVGPEIPKFIEPVMKGPSGSEELGEVDVDPIVSIAPRKPNWDLRRDVAKQLAKLERRTQRAMIELMHEEEQRRQREEAGKKDQEDGD